MILPGDWCWAHDVALGDDGSDDPELGRREAGKGRQDEGGRLHDDEIGILVSGVRKVLRDFKR